MSDAETTEVVETPDPDEPKGLRKQLAIANASIKGFKEKELARSFGEAGLDISTGAGKAYFQQYDGDTEPDSVAEWLKDEYGYEKEVVAVENPQNQVIAQGHAALDQLGQTAGSVPLAPTEGDVLSKAEAEGDYATTMAIKSQQIAQLFGK